MRMPKDSISIWIVCGWQREYWSKVMGTNGCRAPLHRTQLKARATVAGTGNSVEGAEQGIDRKGNTVHPTTKCGRWYSAFRPGDKPFRE
jgi:hypothetical protein